MTTAPTNSQTNTLPPLSKSALQVYRDSLRNAKPPIVGMTWEQYREYQSWRIMLQGVAIYYAAYKIAAGGEKTSLKTKIQEMVTKANLQTNKFPPQNLPEDLVIPVPFDFLLVSDSTKCWLSRMVDQLGTELGFEIVVGAPSSDYVDASK
ncbi:MAG: hypothetical protein QM730_27010 [Anaerolineales bacterium]